MDIREIFAVVALAIESVGVLVIAIGIVISTVIAGIQMLRRTSFLLAFRHYRFGLGRVILLGIEFLVAADIIRTVAVEPTLDNIGVLALLIGLRAFLSLTLELELQGRWPWQQGAGPELPGR